MSLTKSNETNIEELKKSYESQIKALTKELEAEKKKVKTLEVQLAEFQKKAKDSTRASKKK